LAVSIQLVRLVGCGLYGLYFLADRTNGRAYATVLHPSSVAVVCRLYGMYYG